jgi:E3 ubiquitin-protein ligase RNF1/2
MQRPQGTFYQPPAQWPASKQKGSAPPKRRSFSTTRPKVDSADVEVTVSTDLLNVELRCPICLDIMRDPMATPCLHRFCAGCIEKCLRISKHCPSCRSAVATRRSLRRDANFALLVATFYPDLNQLQLEENQITDELSQSHRQLHAEKMRKLMAARVKQQRMAAAHKTFLPDVEPGQPAPKEPSSDGDEEGTASDESASEGQGEEGEEGEEAADEAEGEGEREDACDEPMDVAARGGARASCASALPYRVRGRSGRGRGAARGARGGGRGGIRRKPKQSELKPRRFEFGFWLQPHPKETELPTMAKSYVVTARDAHVRHVQKFVSDKLDTGVMWQHLELSTKKSSGQRVMLKPTMSLTEVLVEYGLDTGAVLFNYRRKR